MTVSKSKAVASAKAAIAAGTFGKARKAPSSASTVAETATALKKPTPKKPACLAKAVAAKRKTKAMEATSKANSKKKIALAWKKALKQTGSNASALGDKNETTTPNKRSPTQEQKTAAWKKALRS